MADPKYADLPGIDYDQADVYETGDLPESDQFQTVSEDETDSIERIHLSASEAFNKFKGKNITSKGVDFSDRISQKRRTGYNIIYGEWELPEENIKETPLQKLRRLQCEVKELYDEIEEIKDKSTNQEEVKSATDIISEVESVGKILNSLKLHEFLGPNLAASLNDPQGTQLMNLLLHIETFKKGDSMNEIQSKPNKVKSEESKDESGILKYEMLYLPENTRMIEERNIASLEQRLSQLENILGTSNSEKLSKFSQTLKCQGIMDAAQQLGTKASLLDSNQLDAVESRISALLHRMDTVAQKKVAAPQDTELEQKVSEMYEIVRKTESMSNILPQAVQRMSTLQAIHQQAARFSKSLTQLEEMQSQLTTGLEGNKTLLQNVQANFASNLETIKKNIVSLDERIKKLK